MHVFPVVQVGGFNLDLSSILAIVVSGLICFVLAKLATRNLSIRNPSKLQNFMEWVVDFVHNTIASTMPLSKVKHFLGLGMTLILFIFVSNLLGLPFGIVTEHHEEFKLFGSTVVSQEYIDEHGGHAHVAWWKSPTADIMVNLGLAVVVFFLIHFLGLKMNRKHYLAHYFKPFPVFFPLNLIEQVARPVTLAVRLYANIYAGELLIATILLLGIPGIPLLAVWQGFSIFVGAVQAFLFTILTMVYISQAIVHEDH
ncbi:ATP synthase subunit a [Thermobacillus xylanilyticus]|jgi:F-type H+-transporting ATPase subunit a|uniref:ATP synthase subunit a n=1 Tax=Thermobacillus xylanilyticus TaxID=76633 RepID=A0ABN7S607_THEXY|nr:F0F1 ATP synthase subunit A [Thermobacillus xylanilyticus]CAG5091399.1 ATP synthase subunit a [Thermobacillus xylanilyticus]